MFRSFRSSLSFISAIGSGIGQLHIGLIAAGVAFYGLFAIFPAITSVVTLWGFFADPDIVEEQLASYEHMMPEAAYQILASRVRSIANGPKEVLGWATIASMGAALWATRAGTAALIGGMNAVYRTPPRGGLKSMGLAILLTLVLIAVALIALAAVVVTPVVLAFLPLGPYTGIALSALRWLTGVAVVLLGIGLLYRLGPNRDGRRSRLFSPGAIFAVVLWAVVSVGFSRYLQNFGRYNEVYGSLGAVIALLMWFYLSAFVVLLGGLLNAELERRNQSEDATPETTSPANEDDPPEAEGPPPSEDDAVAPSS